jgi:hypothetical protein
MTTKPIITAKDNGYFEIWQLPCSHTVRVYTEDTQWSRRTQPGFTARATAATCERLSRPAACPTCKTER